MMASVTNYKGNPNDLMDDTNSGLINYLFGKDRKKEINREKMHQLQQELMDEIHEIGQEFEQVQEYDNLRT